MRKFLLAAAALAVGSSSMPVPSRAQGMPPGMVPVGPPGAVQGGAPVLPGPNPMGQQVAQPGYAPAPQGYQQPQYAQPQQQQYAPQYQGQPQYPQGQAPQNQYAQPQMSGQYAPGTQPVQGPQGYPVANGGTAMPPSPADLAFQQALMGTLPLSNQQGHEYRSRAQSFRREIEEPPNGPPRPTSRSVTLSLRSGEAAPKLHLAPGNASVLTFYDQTGAPWPVMSVTVGDKKAFDVGPAGDKDKTNMVVVSPMTNYAQANLVVTLVGHPVPIMFSLDTGSGSVDYRLDVGIRGRGPNATYDVNEGSSLEPTNDPTVQSFIDGVAPKGSRKVHTSDPDVEAWKFQDMVYVRTPLKMLSPAYVGFAAHPGVNVYTIVDTPVLMMSLDGRTTLVTLDR